MSSSKIAITLESEMLAEIDALVKKRVFPNRSRAIQAAIKEKLSRLNQSILAQECAKLDPEFEKALAEEGLTEDLSEWPEY
ncbi:MAG: ribbon-helix-helix protein, CopG family [Gammaproteobacteria bacterium]|nr:ribbon-helix-helix protein, CopG family [Gammaproteobacteria bacterium]NKC17228.1 ribbon-helix-helix protein, CopG family [Gammaproteobacteria bacterium]